MAEISRRGFVGAGALGAAAGLLTSASGHAADAAPGAAVVDTRGDAPEPTPAEYAALLARLVGEASFVPDEYGLGGAAAELEGHFAALLGQERALFFPTGTMANHVALRTLAAGRRRVVLQDASHVYNDTGDSAQSMSGLNLVPIAPGRATFAWEDVKAVLDRTAGGRVKSDVGVISIESPVRRLHGAAFDLESMRTISKEARARGIRLHLDGARLFIASAYSGVAPAEYGALFDTVYVSLWKYFGAPNGAILAGPADVMEELFHVRRAFGGALWSVWPFAVVARHHSQGFLDRLRAGIRVAEDAFRALQGTPGLTIERIRDGTNVFALRTPDPKAFPQRLKERGILVAPAAPDGRIYAKVNEAWARRSAADIADAFRSAL